MRTVPAAITAARQSAASKVCKIWRIERTDGVVLRFTEHDRDLVVDGETFLATASFDPSSIKASADMSLNDLDVMGAFDSSFITEADLLGGLFHGASFWVAEVLWDDLAAGKDVLRFGRLGNVKETGGKFTAELLGPTWRLQNPIGHLYSAACRATLGDVQCGVDLAPYTFDGTAAAVTSRKTFTALPGSPAWEIPPNDPTLFAGGLVTWVTGGNEGLSMEVYTFDGTTCDLLLSMPYDIEPGDAFVIVAGCQHDRPTCRDRFNNILRFRGEPDVPVSDDLIKGPVRGVDEGEAETPPYDGEEGEAP